MVASFSRRRSFRFASSMRAMRPPRSIWVPGSATQVRRPGVSAAMRASLRLTTVPVAVIVVVIDCLLALPTFTAGAGAFSSCAVAANAHDSITTRLAVITLLSFITVLLAVMRHARAWVGWACGPAALPYRARAHRAAAVPATAAA